MPFGNSNLRLRHSRWHPCRKRAPGSTKITAGGAESRIRPLFCRPPPPRCGRHPRSRDVERCRADASSSLSSDFRASGRLHREGACVKARKASAGNAVRLMRTGGKGVRVAPLFPPEGLCFRYVPSLWLSISAFTDSNNLKRLSQMIAETSSHLVSCYRYGRWVL